MWLNRFSNYILEHRYAALLLTFLLTFIPVLGAVAILIAAFITLVKGIAEGAVFTLAATLPYLISFYFSAHGELTVPLALWVAIGVAVFSNLLTWVFASMLVRQSSWSTILQVAALIGVFVISVLHLAYPNVADWWGKELQTYYTQGASLLKGVPLRSPELQTEAINVTKQYASGLLMAAILFNAILQLIIARWWQAALYKPGQLREELHWIRLSQLAGFAFIASLVLSYLGNRLVLDIMPILYLLFMAAGLSVVHYLFGLMESPSAWFWLTLFYVIVIISFPSSIVVLGLIGLMDIWFDIRKRFNKDNLSQ